MVPPQQVRRLLIGEFAAATQLSPKALRLYDEQGILRPAGVDGTNGYRYYSADQVAAGRLVRTLREMDLSLAEVAEVVGAGARAEVLLGQFAQEADRRFARRRHAFQAALAMIRRSVTGEALRRSGALGHGEEQPKTREDAPAIVDGHRPAGAVVVRPFLADRRSLYDRFVAECAAGGELIEHVGLAAQGEPYCSLVDPLTDEDGRSECFLPVVVASRFPPGVTLRQLGASSRGLLTMEVADPGTADWAVGVDALFDWLDRRGARATEPPSVAFAAAGAGLRLTLSWAYEGP